MIASLPMYDWPHRRAANDALWAHIAEHLRGCGLHAPKKLSRPTDIHRDWRRPSLLLSQTCAMPYRLGLWQWCDVIGTLDYGLPGCGPGQYCSAIIARADDPREALSQFAGEVPAVNAPDSQSGWAALNHEVMRAGIKLAAPVVTGAHAGSIRAVAIGECTLAAIDAVSWGLAVESMPEAGRLKVIARSEPSPALPFITARGQDITAIQAGMAAAFEALPNALAVQFGDCRFLARTNELYRAEPWE